MSDKISLEDVLLLLAFGLDILAAPGRHRYGTDYEQWLERFGWRRRLERLRHQGMLDRTRRGTRWVYRLAGSVPGLNRRERNPEIMWQREWDGWWRQIVFDLPVGPGHRRTRMRLLRWLRTQGFGYLQDSVWIRPDRVDAVSNALKEYGGDAAVFTILESRCVAGFSDQTLVKASWPFEEIGRGYRQYEDFAAGARKRLHRKDTHPRDLFTMLRQERNLWNAGFVHDPLLPRCLWPDGYRGTFAWHARRELIRAISRSFSALCRG